MKEERIMKRIPSIKWMLLGIAFILLFPMGDSLSGAHHTVVSAVLCAAGIFGPIIGLPLCIYGFFKKDEPYY